MSAPHEACAIEAAPWLVERLTTSWRRAMRGDCEWRDLRNWLRGMVVVLDCEATRRDRERIADELFALVRFTHALAGLEQAHGRPLLRDAPPLACEHRGANP